MPIRSMGHTPLVWPAIHLQAILHADCDALVDVILRLARENGYADQTSSMRSAWTAAAECINQCLTSYLSDPIRQDNIDGRHSYCLNPHFQDLRDTALRHHDVGVPLELYNGLLKLFRRVYLNHFAAQLQAIPQTGTPSQTGTPLLHSLHSPDAFMANLNTFFDKAELASLEPWESRKPKDGAFKESLRRLARERDQYFAAVESLRNPVFITDENGGLITANQAALHAFVDPSEAGALTYRRALQPHRIELQHIVDEILASPDRPCHAIWMQTLHGKRCFDILVRNIEDTVEKLENWHIILMHDVTEHHLATQRSLEAERAMTLFLAAMSHEIRAPLHSVLGAAGLVKDASPEDVGTLINLLEISARSLNATLDNVLNFSRFEHQAPQPCPVTIDLGDSLCDLLRIKEIYARQQNVPLRLKISPDVPQRVLLDWSMTHQILNNLLRNALRHDDGRGVEISVHAESAHLVFQISDHGPGLPEDIRDALTHPRTELRPRRTGRNGAGLGLAIAQRMTRALEGSIAALHSQDGAVIELRLPLRIPPGLAQPSTHKAPANERLDLECLLIDDDPINAMVTMAMLQRIGLTVDHAYTLDQAYALLQADPGSYKVFIIDYQLTNGCGADFARYLRRDPAHHATPVFLLSANVEWVRQFPEDARLFTALLEKPLDTTSLAQAIRNETEPRRPVNMLAGVSSDAQRKMAGVFSQQWLELHSIVLAARTEKQDKDIAIRAHKLSSGAAIFGLKSTADALKQVEWAHTDAAADPPGRALAHNALLACTLPSDWLHETAAAQ